MDIVISDSAVGHTLININVADPTHRDLVQCVARRISPSLQMRSEGRKPTIGTAHLGLNLCPSLLRRNVHHLIGRIDFWLSVQR